MSAFCSGNLWEKTQHGSQIETCLVTSATKCYEHTVPRVGVPLTKKGWQKQGRVSSSSTHWVGGYRAGAKVRQFLLLLKATCTIDIY